MIDWAHALPGVNAALNAVAATLLWIGRTRARSGRIEAHRHTMLTAFAVSSLFLALYVSRKAVFGFETVHYAGEGAARLAYLALLGSHVVLAAAVPFLAVALVALGLRDRRAAHRRLARVAWPIWMYVSLTGVAIYFWLYGLPGPGSG